MIKSPISLDTSSKLKEMLVAVVEENGTGSKAKIKGYRCWKNWYCSKSKA